MKYFFISLALFFALNVFAQPTITSFAPTTGPIGTAVTITGTNFSAIPANNIVRFGAVRASVTAATSTQLNVTVPAGTTYGFITVTTGQLVVTSSKPFIVSFSGSSIDDLAFSSKVEFAVGNNSIEFYPMDFDADGKTDVAVLNYNDQTVSILRNTTVGKTPSFVLGATLSRGSEIRNLEFADMDGNGQVDIIASACCTTPVSIFKNVSTPGTISFSSAVTFTMTLASDLAVGDIDGDGKVDLIVGSNSITVYQNTTTGGVLSFTNPVTLPGKNGNTHQLIDIDGDRKPDLVSTQYINQEMEIYRNTSTVGTISFAPKVTFAGATSPTQVTFGDYDGDGKPDIAHFDNSATTIKVLKNGSSVGTIAFSAPQVFDVNEIGLSALTTADVNGDAIPELIVNAGPTGSVFPLTISWNGTAFSLGPKVGFYTSAPYATFADIDNDGKTDILGLGDGSPGSLKVLRNKVNEPVIQSYAPATAQTGTLVVITGTGFSNVTQVTFGGVAASSFTITSPTTIEAIVGAGGSGSVTVSTLGGSYSLPGFSFYNGPAVTSFAPTSGPVGAQVTITGLRFSPTPANNIVRFGTTTAVVQSATANQLVVTVPPGAASRPISVTTNYLTGVSGRAFNVTFAGGGTITASSFAIKTDVGTDAGNYLVKGDIDGDSKTDLIVVNTSLNKFSVLRNTGTPGTPSFATPVYFTTGSTPVTVATGDLNGDGKLDVVVTNSSSSSVSVFKNTSTTGNVSFDAKLDVTTGVNPQSVAIGDLDGDGYMDIATANFTGANLVSILRNTSSAGSLSFAPKIDVTAVSFPSAVGIRDLTNDGKPELVVANSNSANISIYKNISTGGVITFSPKVEFATENFPISIDFGDLNADGRQEVIVANSNSSSVTFWLNNTTVNDVSLTAKTSITVGSSPNQASVGDLNGDGKIDIAVANKGVNGTTISILRNATTSSFVVTMAPKVDFTVGVSPTTIAICDYDGDGFTDIATASEGQPTVSVLRNTISSITSFAPSSAGPGMTITITGTNLYGTSQVKFGGTPASSFTMTSPTTIAAVLAGGTTGSVEVTTPSGALTLPGFTFVQAPAITSFSPILVGPNIPVTITGSNFIGATAVTFGGTPAKSFSMISNNTIIAVVDNGTSGAVAVTTPGGNASLSGLTFDPLITGTEDGIKLNEGVTLFPNPSTGREFFLAIDDHYKNAEVQISILDAKGLVVSTPSLVHDGVSAPAVRLSQALETGLYFVKLKVRGETSLQKLLVVH